MRKTFTCIVCPNGCEITVEQEGEGYRVSGESCPRGKTYVLQEMTDPQRTIATSVRVVGGDADLCSVRLTRPIPKARIMDAVREIHARVLKAPVRAGDVVIAGILGTDSDVIALSGRGVGKKDPEHGFRLYEYIGKLEEGQTLLLPSDDLIRAGFGEASVKGYAAAGEVLAQYLGRLLDRDPRPTPPQMLELLAQDMALKNRGGPPRDLTALGLTCRPARLLALATGPPRDISRDGEFTDRLMNSPGLKAVCGSTTAELVARELDRPLTCLNPDNYVDPPEYAIPGIDLITEGAVALNRVANILDDDLSNIKQPNVVERLAQTLLSSDKIQLIQGRAVNTAHEASLFKQMGIRTRHDVVEQICANLEQRGKIIERIYF